jgi:hypothetical protein
VPIIAFTKEGLSAKLGASTKLVTGEPACGVDVRYMQYGTVGGAGEATDASGVVMIPTGPGAACGDARPIVLYGHGTTISKGYNLADVANPNNPAAGESGLLMAMYAAQGFIVVAPNYAGYDTSRLGYHPYVNATQQSTEMIDALNAAKSGLPAGKASTKLFVTGYSQGGFVAMATQRALQLAGTPVNASAPMSGPYALAAYLDAIFSGRVALGSTAFAPLATNSFQKAYGNIYTTPADIYETAYATGIESLVPGPYDFTTVYSSGKLPQTALFSSTLPAPGFESVIPPIAGDPGFFALGFGTNNLIKNSARLDYLMDATLNPAAPVNKIRVAGKANDLRNGWPGPLTTPTLLCGGNADPTVFYSVNTQAMATLWSAQVTAGLVTVLDVDSAPGTAGPANPFYAVKAGFAQNKAAVASAAGANAASVVTSAYHGSLVPPFCNAAARGFFQMVLASGG